jgi:hypothetical protein
MIAELALVALLSQPTVTLVFRDREVTMTVAEAERQLATETDLRWQVALTHALGTVPCHVAERLKPEPSCQVQRAAGLL